MWTPTRLRNGEGCTGREETRAGSRNWTTSEHLQRSTGVMSTACGEGDLQRVGEARGWWRVAPPTSSARAAASPGVGEGHTTEEAGQRRGGKGPCFWCACDGGRVR